MRDLTSADATFEFDQERQAVLTQRLRDARKNGSVPQLSRRDVASARASMPDYDNNTTEEDDEKIVVMPSACVSDPPSSPTTTEVCSGVLCVVVSVALVVILLKMMMAHEE